MRRRFWSNDLNQGLKNYLTNYCSKSLLLIKFFVAIFILVGLMIWLNLITLIVKNWALQSYQNRQLLVLHILRDWSALYFLFQICGGLCCCSQVCFSGPSIFIYQMIGNIQLGILINQMFKILEKTNLTLALRSQMSFTQFKTVGNVDFQQEKDFLKVVLNRPKALNSLNIQMIKDITSELPTISANKAFWIEGTGGKAFCAGGDVKALFQKDAKIEDRLDFFRQQFTLDYKLSQLNTIQIANWDGIVMGGGFGISAFAPFIIATENSMFAMPQAKLGFFTDVGSSYLLSRLHHNIGYYLGLTGSRLKGQQLYVSGLAHYYIERLSIEAAYNEIKQALPTSTNPRETIRHILGKYHRPTGKKGIAHQEQVNQIFGLQSPQAIYKRIADDSDKFCQGVVKAMNEQCPISLGVVHRLIKSAKNKTLKECFIQDFNICQHSIVDPNFAEGVRTVLVERGAVPNWSHKHILQVKDSDVDKYFEWPSTFETLNI